VEKNVFSEFFKKHEKTAVLPHFGHNWPQFDQAGIQCKIVKT
jgi:hypothetical protein